MSSYCSRAPGSQVQSSLEVKFLLNLFCSSLCTSSLHIYIDVNLYVILLFQSPRVPGSVPTRLKRFAKFVSLFSMYAFTSRLHRCRSTCHVIVMTQLMVVYPFRVSILVKVLSGCFLGLVLDHGTRICRVTDRGEEKICEVRFQSYLPMILKNVMS